MLKIDTGRGWGFGARGFGGVDGGGEGLGVYVLHIFLTNVLYFGMKCD